MALVRVLKLVDYLSHFITRVVVVFPTGFATSQTVTGWWYRTSLTSQRWQRSNRWQTSPQIWVEVKTTSAVDILRFMLREDYRYTPRSSLMLNISPALCVSTRVLHTTVWALRYIFNPVNNYLDFKNSSNSHIYNIHHTYCYMYYIIKEVIMSIDCLYYFYEYILLILFT